MKISSPLNIVFATLYILLIVNFGHAEETIYGWQLMTKQERIEHRKKMRSFTSEQEREAYRQEHHKKMQARAKEQGVTLPYKPQQMGKGLSRPGKGIGAGSKR